jgi:signal-transduction protein with cAMP-binding, CBS, and nucleotidyltransferase domain
MEAVLRFLTLVVFLGVVALPLGVLAAGIAHGSGKSELEDQAQYEHFNPLVKPVAEVYHKEATPLQTKDSAAAVTVGNNLEKAAVSDDLGKTKFVHGVMEKEVYYCRENLSVDEALRIMREHELPYLPVVDSSLRVVGTVKMKDVMDRPNSEG